MRAISTGNALRLCCAIMLLMTIPKTGMAQVYRLRVNITDTELNAVSNANLSINNQTFTADSTGKHNDFYKSGRCIISVTAVGHYPATITILLNKDTSINILLRVKQNTLSDVVVTASQRLHKAQMGTQHLSISQLRKLPVILGEIDPMKTITLLPGIKNGGEASAGIYVRGGGPDQNLVLLDGIPVYNPNHLLGFFSVFNGEAIKGVDVIKGGIPAEYGGRLSSVIAVDTRTGNKDSTSISGGIGLMATRLAVEGPIVKGRSSYMISGRRTYLDQAGKLVARDKIGNNGYYFYDLNAKIDQKLNDDHSLSATIYTGRDQFGYGDMAQEGDRSFTAGWGNSLAGLTWKQQVRPSLKQQLSVIYNQFNLDSRFGFNTANFLFSSGLKDYQVKNDWQYTLNARWRFKTGIQYTWHQFKPGAGEVKSGEQDFKPDINEQHAREAAAYISAETDVTDRLQIAAGLRYSYFNQVGPTEKVIYQDDGTPTGEREKYNRGESIARYHYPEPRLNILYSLGNNSGIKGSYTRTIQYLHLATTSAATFPSDLWIPSSRSVKPGQAQQVAAGYYRDLFNRNIQFSVEAYYKQMTNQIEFRPGAQLLLNQNLEGEMIFGKGEAYGIELLLQKKQGRLTGWIGYTLSRANRKFADLNDGKSFPYRYDRTHDLSIVGNYRINKHWEGSAVFVYGTGNALTLPTGRFTYNTGFTRSDGHFIFSTIDQYTKINDFRMPAYHRLDIAFIYTRKPDKTSGLRSSWNFSVYNVYNRYNPYFIYLDVDRFEKRISAQQVYLFPVLPSITWNFKLD